MLGRCIDDRITWLSLAYVASVASVRKERKFKSEASGAYPAKIYPSTPPPPSPHPLSREQNLKCYNIECCKKYIGQIYTDSLVHDEKAFKLLVDSIGKVKSSVTFDLFN